MLLQVRIRLADRPGSLGRVTWTLGVLGADIYQVVVLGRQSGRAVDDFTVELPGSVSRERLVATLQEIPGVVVDGVWPAAVLPGVSTEVAVVGQIAADPTRGPATLVDALPRLFGADWAVLVTCAG
ncbi:MAG TPA: amino acid-binding protein, partial [Micromonosporaceae bacterium]